MDEYKDLEKGLNPISLDVFLEKDEKITAELIIKAKERMLDNKAKIKIAGFVTIVYLWFVLPIFYIAKIIKHYLWFIAFFLFAFTAYTLYCVFLLFEDNSKKADDKIGLTNKSIIYKFENKYKKVPFDDIEFIEIKKNMMLNNYEFLEMNIYLKGREFPDNVLGLKKDSGFYDDFLKVLKEKIYVKYDDI